jgi:hypothetical protein
MRLAQVGEVEERRWPCRRASVPFHADTGCAPIEGDCQCAPAEEKSADVDERAETAPRVAPVPRRRWVFMSMCVDVCMCVHVGCASEKSIGSDRV